MKFHNPNAEYYVPEGTSLPEALAKVTHLGIGAHQDDLEFMAFHGIRECFYSNSKWFAGVICTDGAGSARSNAYANCTDTQMQALRRREQRQAADIGRYAAIVQLDYPSHTVKDPADLSLKDDLKKILEAACPSVVYTHNPADKHDTHIGVLSAALQAMRELPAEQRPQQVYGCEVWRGLDWMLDDEKIGLDVSGLENIAAALNGVFDSQIAGGKRYDLATVGRQRANATYFQSHATDQAELLSFAMDLTPLVKDESADIVGYVTAIIDRFRADVVAKLNRQFGK